MTFLPSSSGSGFNPDYTGACDEIFQNSQFPQHRHASFYTYPPNIGSVSHQNFDLNYYPISTRNVPYSSFSPESCYQLPYANHAAVPSRFQHDPWANVCSGETYFQPAPDSCCQFPHNSTHDCYNVQRNFTHPDTAYSHFSQLDCEYPVGCNAGRNQQSSNIGFVNGSYMMASPSQLQHYQCPPYALQHKEIVNSGIDDCFAVPHDYCSDEIMQNTLTSSAKLTSEDGNTFGMQPSFVYENMQQPTFGHYSPYKQSCVSDLKFEANDGRLDTSSITNYNAEVICVNKSESVSHQSLGEIPPFRSSRRILSDDFTANTRGYADFKSPSSGVMISSASETQASHIDTISTASDGSVCQPWSEMPLSQEETVTFMSSVNTFDRLSTVVQSTCCGKTLSQCSSFPEQTLMVESDAVSDSTDGCEIPVKEDEWTEVEVSTSSDAATTTSTPATSVSMQLRNWQLQAESSERTQIGSAIHLARVTSLEMNVASKCAASSEELMLEVTATAETHAARGDSTGTVSNSSDDVVVLSPLPSAAEPTCTFTNHKSDLVESHCCRMQPACVRGRLNTDHQMHSILRPIVPKSLPARLPRVSGHAVEVPHCGSSPSVLLTNRDFCKSRNLDVLPSHGKHIINHNCSVQTTSCQRHLSRRTVSCIPATYRQSSFDINTPSSVKPMFHKPPVIAVRDSTRDAHLHSAQTEPQRQLYLTPSSLNKSLPKPRTCNQTLESNNHCDTVENSQHTRHWRSLLQSPASSQALLQHAIAQHNAQRCIISATSASQTVSSISSSGLCHFSSAVRIGSEQNRCTNYKYHSLPLRRLDRSALHCQGMSLRKNGTYSIRAASMLLQRLKQAKLSDFTAAHSARHLLLNRRLSLPSQNGEVIDLTGDDDGNQHVVETCEVIFARAHRRNASVPVLYRPRQSLFRRGSLADSSCCDSEIQSKKKTFAVDRSLSFYRCFVQKLLRNHRFTSSGVPVKVYPEFMPPAPPSMSFVNRDAPSTAHSCITELVKKRQPVVLLKKLDDSVLNKYGVAVASARNEAEKCVSVSDNASRKSLSTESHNKDSVPVSQNGVSTHLAQKLMEFDRTERLNVQKENVSMKLTGNEQRFDELLSLCRPVSVVLERLDGIKIHQIGKELCETKQCSQDNQTIMQLETKLSVSDLSWTVSQIPRANKVPILVIRALPLAVNALQNKVTKETHVCATHQLRSRSKYLGTDGGQHFRNLAPDSSKFNVSLKRTFRKVPRYRTLCSSNSLLMSPRSRNRVSRGFCRHKSTHVTRSPCQNSSKLSRRQSESMSKLLLKRVENDKKLNSKLTIRLHKPESLVTSSELAVQLGQSHCTPANSLLTDLLPYDTVVNQNLPEGCGSLDSNTIELTPLLFDKDLHSVTSCAFPKNDSSADSVSRDLVFDEGCGTSDSNTVALSPCSSIEDSTIVYRSPVSDVFDFDEPSLDQQETLEGNLETGEKIDIIASNVDQKLKPTSNSDCDQIISQPYTTTVSGSVQHSSDLLESSTFSESFSCCLVSINSELQQSTLVQHTGSVSDGLEKQSAITTNNHFYELVDKSPKKCEMAASVATEVVLETTSAGPEEEVPDHVAVPCCGTESDVTVRH